MKRLLPFFVILIMVQFTNASDMDTIKSRMVNEFLEKYSSTTTVEVENIIALQQVNGSFPDVDYADRDNNWDPYNHLNRLRLLSYAYGSNMALSVSSQSLLDNYIIKEIEYWYAVNPTCTNWFKNDIGKQHYLREIVQPIFDNISASLQTKIIKDFPTGWGSMTGANKVFFCANMLYRAVLTKDSTLLNKTVGGFTSEIAFTTKEGVQQDYSFHQHGAQLYSGSYGEHFLKEEAIAAYFVNNTAYSFPTNKVNLLTDYYLNGIRWMIYKNKKDYSIIGRRIVFESNTMATNFISILKHLEFANTDILIKQELNDAHQNIKNNKRQNVIGNRHFYRSDYTTHQEQYYFSSVKMNSSRVKATESGNGENVKGYWLSFGTTFIYRDAMEYHYIFPVWDWAKLPGVTAPNKVYTPSAWGKIIHQKDFVGGVSDARYGVTAMDLNIRSTQAKKSWFHFGNEIVALGAGITSTHTNTVNTTINQCFLNNDILMDNKPVAKESTIKNAANWLYNDSIAYIFPEGENINLTTVTQTGKISNIYTLGSTELVSGEVFKLWIDHGLNPINKSYSYIVVPAVSSAEALAYSQNIPVEIIQNTTSVQLVRKGSIYGLVSYKGNQEIQINDSISLVASEACIMLIDLRANPVITVSDPTHKLLDLDINLKYKTSNFKKNVKLPSGNYVGKSIAVNFDGVTISNIAKADKSVVNNIKIYQNLFKNLITIELEENEQANIKLVDLSGRVIKDIYKTKKLNTISTDNISSGVYLIIISTPNAISVQKIFKR